ncbi:hypothetical protein BDP27DRAFT_1432442 [Rhodocollybia butyracea]|uniref:CDP-diacylglycerol--glycerol-3-phosphate 3-phosphatidyltransferase n=1 Tax=Rhodocollybia butyracea TaxID=206335 RepID=A0A9P5P5I3_9AGAR|nr:hypothetical protein BDP27DRAFT_1432442 [Rhodocollybia butyracea]
MSGEYAVVWADPETHPHKITEKVHKALTEFQVSHRTSNDEKPEDSSRNSSNRLLLPIIQFRVREEESSIPGGVSSISQERPLMDLTSGYFSLYKHYQDFILGTPQVAVRIVAASPKANGFFGLKGISGRIPEGYTSLEQKFMKSVARAATTFAWLGLGLSNVELNEWEKDRWTYHAKGLWFSPRASSLPVLSLFGSTNLNSRSADIDTELLFVMTLPPTHGPEDGGRYPVVDLRGQWAREIVDIRVDAKEWNSEQRKMWWLTKVIVY